MHRQSRQIVNTVADVKENVKGIIEEDGNISSMPVPKDKIINMDESKSTKVSEMENLKGGSPTNVQKPRVKCNKYVRRKSYQNSKDGSKLTVNESLSVKQKGNLLESSLSFLTPDKMQSPFSEGRSMFLGDASYLMPNKGITSASPNSGTSEKLMKKPIDFARVTVAEFGISPESFTAKSSVGKSMALKLRRRSTIGVRGSPENNSLIRYLAQQRKNRTEDPFTKASPFKHQNVGSLKDRVSAFQSFFQSVQEDEGRACFPGLSQEERVSQAASYSQNKPPFTKQHELSQLSEELTSECKSVAYRENLKEKLTNGDKTAASFQVCKIVSPPVEVPIIESTTTTTVSKETPCTPSITECGSLSLEIISVTDIPKTPHNFTSECISEEAGSNTRSQLSRKKVTFEEALSLKIFDEAMPPVTTPQKGNLPSSEQSHNGSSCLRSVLKRTPVKLLMESVKEHISNPTGMEGNEPLLFSDLSRSCEELQTDGSNTKTIDETDMYSSEKPMKRKRVTFGEDLSPEVFDKTLPANTPLRKGATPISNPGSQSDCPSTVISPMREPLSQPNFDDCDDDEYVKPLEESVAVPENMKEINSFDNTKSCPRVTRSSAKRKYINISEETGASISTGITAKNAQDIKNLRKSKLQRGKENKSVPKKIPKVKLRGYRGKRGKKKVEKSLYGQREVASKKPPLSPIPEIPEVFSSAPSSPNSPKTHILLFSDHSKSSSAHIGSMNEVIEETKVVGRLKRINHPNTEELDIVEASSTSGTECQPSASDPDPASTINIEVLNIQEKIQTENELKSSLMSLEQKESNVCVNDSTSEEDSNDKTSCQQSEPSHMREHTSPVIVKSNSLLPPLNTIRQEIKSTSPFDIPDHKEHEKERDVLIENECVLESDHPLNNSEVLKELEFLNLQDVGVSENTQSGCSVTDFARERTADSDASVKRVKSSSRKGRRSTIYLSELEHPHLETFGNNLSGSFTNEQEPRIENDSEIFSDLHYSVEQSFLKAREDCDKKVRRSMRLHKNAENEGLAWIKIPIEIHKNSDSARKSRQTMCASIFKESENIHQRPENWIPFSALGKGNNECVPVAAGSCKTRRRSMCASTSQETKNITQTRKKRRASLVYNDKNYQKESEVEVSFENQPNV